MGKGCCFFPSRTFCDDLWLRRAVKKKKGSVGWLLLLLRCAGLRGSDGTPAKGFQWKEKEKGKGEERGRFLKLGFVNCYYQMSKTTEATGEKTLVLYNNNNKNYR